MSGSAVFVVNSGSSSLKFGVFAAAAGTPGSATLPAGQQTGAPTDRPASVRAVYRGEVEGIGGTPGKIEVRAGTGEVLLEEQRDFPTQKDAARAVAKKFSEIGLPELCGVGHRVVHGGPTLTTHQKITPDDVRKLEAAAHFAPLHMPAALELIRETQQLFPGVPQFACFDTAFHRTLPEAAARLPLPQKFWDAGIRKYGFHGISCESIVHALRSELPPRLIVAHLGNGASITAIANGKSVDTSMGLTPTGGIIMGTRPGDLDPGVLLHILRSNGDNVGELARLLDKESGLLGISGFSRDMRSLHQAAAREPAEPPVAENNIASESQRAQLAIEMFARSAKKTIASYVAILGGLDLLVFTGGIGEHDAAIRAQICQGMDCFGVRLDGAANAGGANTGSAATISAANSVARVRVITSDEELQIARHVFQLIGKSSLPPSAS